MIFLVISYNVYKCYNAPTANYTVVSKLVYLQYKILYEFFQNFIIFFYSLQGQILKKEEG